MKVEQLEIGRKYQHANGICMYTGSIKMSEPELDHAIFVFNNSDKTYIPHHSLYLITSLVEDISLTDMEMDEEESELSNKEILELFNII